MIRINLLPFRAARKKENIRRQISVFFLSVFLMLAVLIYYNIHLGGRIKTLKKSVAVTGNELKKYQKITQQIENLGLLEERTGRNHGLFRLKPVAGFTVDLFPAWAVDGKVYVFPHTFGELDIADVLPFAKCGITGLNIPAQPEKMLAINYGPGWKEKDPLWKFVQPTGFNRFLSRVKPT